MKTSVIILISLFTTGMTANSYCDQQYQQLQTAANNIRQKCSTNDISIKSCCDLNPLLSLRHLLVSTKCSVGVEENGVPLVFTVILKQQMEDGQ